jgi:hypothetical protein
MNIRSRNGTEKQVECTINNYLWHINSVLGLNKQISRVINNGERNK